MIHYAWIIALERTLVLLLGQGFGRLPCSVILPSMKDGLLLTYTQVGLIGTAKFIGYLSLAFVMAAVVSLLGAGTSMLLRERRPDSGV